MTFQAFFETPLAVSGRVQTGEDGGGQPIYADALKGTMRGTVQPRTQAEEVNGPDLNPVISDYTGISEVPSFDVLERDTLTDTTGVYEILGVADVTGRGGRMRHLELTLRKVTP